MSKSKVATRDAVPVRTRFITHILLIMLAFMIVKDILARRRAALTQSSERDTSLIVR